MTTRRAAGGVDYVATMPDAVYVLHAFQKQTQRTEKRDIELAAARYRQLRRGTSP